MTDTRIRHYIETTMEDPSQNAHFIADKSKSISEMDDSELQALANRLRSEQEIERLIFNLRENAMPNVNVYGPERQPIDTVTPIVDMYHHGIMGMKWGVRRFQREDGTRTPAGKKRDAANDRPSVSEDYKTTRANRKKGLKGISTDELKQLNARLQLEKSYRELTAAELQSSESKVSRLLKEIGTKSIATAGSALGAGLLKNFVVDPILEKTKKK